MQERTFAVKQMGYNEHLEDGCTACDAEIASYGYAYLAGEVALCGSCANEIANLYNYEHSGEYLTWDNHRPQRPAYRKKKISATLRTKVFERDMYRCVHCGTHKDLCADHIYPESLGGPTELGNLQTLCRSCNSKKGAEAA